MTRRTAPPPRPSRLPAGLLAATVLFLVTPGCGSARLDAGQVPRPETVGRALAAPLDRVARTARYRIGTFFPVTGSPYQGREFATSGEGVADLTAGRFRVVLHTPDLEGGPEQVMGVVVIDGRRYFQSPPGEGPWLGQPEEENLILAVPRLPILPSTVTDTNTRKALMEAVLTGTTVVGTEQLRGVTTIHYRAMVDITLANERVGPEMAKLLTGTGATTVPGGIDVWVDNRDRVRKAVWVAEQSNPSGFPISYVRWEIELWDFDADLRVDIPPDLPSTTSIGPSTTKP